MRLLLDTHLVLVLLQGSASLRQPALATRLSDPATVGFVSVASLWEIAIKTRLGKLDPGMPLDLLPHYLDTVGLSILRIEAAHAVTAAEPEPLTRDPFDRLLLAQCRVESLALATFDRALANHPLALRI